MRKIVCPSDAGNARMRLVTSAQLVSFLRDRIGKILPLWAGSCLLLIGKILPLWSLEKHPTLLVRNSTGCTARDTSLRNCHVSYERFYSTLGKHNLATVKHVHSTLGKDNLTTEKTFNSKLSKNNLTTRKKL